MVFIAIVDCGAGKPFCGKHKVVEPPRRQELQRGNLHIAGSAIQFFENEQTFTLGWQERGRRVDRTPIRADLGDSDKVNGFHQRQIPNDEANAQPFGSIFKQAALPDTVAASEKDRLIRGMRERDQVYDRLTCLNGHHRQHPQNHLLPAAGFERFRAPWE